jgi:hypothetical protein
MPCHGIRTYAILSHGSLVVPEGSDEEDVILLPRNYMVIMNCRSERQMCNLLDQAALYKLYSHPVFEMSKIVTSDQAVDAYLDKLLELDGLDTNNYCIFKGRCPNLSFSPELENWRDGIFQLPITCLPLKVYTGLGKHLNTGNFERCNDTYKQFAVPAMGEEERDMMKEQVMDVFSTQAPTLRDALGMFHKEPRSENHVHVIIVHACTNTSQTTQPMSYRHDHYINLTFRRRNTHLIRHMLFEAASFVACGRLYDQSGSGQQQGYTKTKEKTLVDKKPMTVYVRGSRKYFRTRHGSYKLISSLSDLGVRTIE